MRLIRSFGYALRGIQAATEGQLNIRIHLVATIVVTAAGSFFHISAYEWCLIIFCFAIVLAAELFNSAIETLTDLVSPDHHPLAGRTKDIAAGAVLVTAIATAIIAILIFGKYLLQYIH